MFSMPHFLLWGDGLCPLMDEFGVHWKVGGQSHASCASDGLESYWVWRTPALSSMETLPCVQFHLISKVNFNLCQQTCS